MMDFIFVSPPKMDRRSLLQGDLLVRNELLKSVLAQAHSYYAEAPDYQHYIVLTQSCDLVRRRGKPPKSRYITLAAARPLSIVVDRFTARHRFTLEEFPVPLCNKISEIRARQLLERLIHNTEDGFFFLRKDSHPELVEDLCVFLPLSVAVRSEHYDQCLAAKIGQMEDIFSARVGWLVGNMYSQVGTPDLEEKIADAEEYKERFYVEALFDKTAWLSAQQFRRLRGLIREWRRENPGVEIDVNIAHRLLEKVPTNQEILADRAVELLEQNELIDRVEHERARTLLRNDTFIAKLIGAGQ